MRIRIPHIRRAIGTLSLALLAALPLASPAQNTYSLPLVLPADGAGLEGFVRIVNRSFQPGVVRIHAFDDTGERFGPVTLTLEAEKTVNLTSRDLERGRAAKGLPVGIGDGTGWWRLALETDLAVTPLAYVRTVDGFLTGMHDVVPVAEGNHRVLFFNPGSNTSKVSRLRLINPGTHAAEVTIHGRDDAGDAAPGGTVRLTLPVGASRTLTAQDLETGGEGFEGNLGDGAGKWRLSVSADQSIEVMSLLRSPTGHLSNLSTAPETPASVLHTLPFVLPADGAGLEGFVRIVNRSFQSGAVRIHAFDDTGERFGPVTLDLDAEEAINLNSRDLEQGSSAKGLPDGLGDGEGSWRLEFETALDIAPLAYVRSTDGFLTGMHDVVPVTEGNHRVLFFNPGSNTSKVSRLRLINPGADTSEVTIQGRDDAGAPAPGGAVRLTLEPGASRTLTAQALEAGGEGIAGALGDGAGKWRLSVTADRTIEVMGLLRSPTGHLSNLSTEPLTDDGPVTFAGADALDVSGGEVSGQLDSPGDVDYYRVMVDEPSILTMNVSSDADVVVTVFDERGHMIPQLVSREAAARAGRIRAAASASVAILVPSGRNMVRVSTSYGSATVGGDVEWYRLASRLDGVGLRQIRPFPETELVGNGSVSIDLNPYFVGVNGVSGIYLAPLRVRTAWGPLDVSLSAGLVLTVSKPAWNLQLECGDGEDEIRLAVKVGLSWFDARSFPLHQSFGTVPLVLRRPEDGPRDMLPPEQQLAVMANKGESRTIRLTDYFYDLDVGQRLTFRVSHNPPGWYLDIDHTSEGAILTARAPHLGAENDVATVAATDPNGGCAEFPVNLIAGTWRCCDVVYTDGFNVYPHLDFCGCVFETSSRWFDYSWFDPRSPEYDSLYCRNYPGVRTSRVNSCGSGCEVGRAISDSIVYPGGQPSVPSTICGD